MPKEVLKDLKFQIIQCRLAILKLNNKPKTKTVLIEMKPLNENILNWKIEKKKFIMNWIIEKIYYYVDIESKMNQS